MRGARATAHYAATHPPAINPTCFVALRQFEESSEALWDVLCGGRCRFDLSRPSMWRESSSKSWTFRNLGVCVVAIVSTAQRWLISGKNAMSRTQIPAALAIEVLALDG